MKKKEFLSILVSSFVGILFTASYDIIKSKPILTTFKTMLIWVWDNIFTYQVSLWVILSILAIIIAIDFFYDKIDSNKQQQSPKPDFLHYKSGFIKNVNWKWEWEENYLTKKWSIVNLSPICSCKTRMPLDEFYTQCPRCDRIYQCIPDPETISRIIIDNIERELY